LVSEKPNPVGIATDEYRPAGAKRGDRLEQYRLNDNRYQRKATSATSAVWFAESKPLSTHEVNKILKAHVKKVARDISAIVNGSKEIVLVNEEPLSEVFEVATPLHDGNKAETKLGGEVIAGPTHILERPVSGIGSQRSYRSVSPSSSKGVEVLPANSYPAGICWPRRLR
jgi:hypothetical protein